MDRRWPVDAKRGVEMEAGQRIGQADRGGDRHRVLVQDQRHDGELQSRRGGERDSNHGAGIVACAVGRGQRDGVLTGLQGPLRIKLGADIGPASVIGQCGCGKGGEGGSQQETHGPNPPVAAMNWPKARGPLPVAASPVTASVSVSMTLSVLENQLAT